MDRNLIWAVKTAKKNITYKEICALMEREDLFDESTVNTKSREYLKTVKSFEKAHKMGCHVITYIDERYPECLRTIPLPPPVLYVMGNPDILNGVVYAGFVGSRKSDEYGKRMAQVIAMEVGESGAGIVSGGAEGIDAASHEGAVRAKAPTIAVLGGGLDNLYPKCNIDLFRRIVKGGGALITEFPFGEPPKGSNFPHRNRIIAAFSTAVAVIRAGARSGALITASQTMDLNKTVFALPGNVDHHLSKGTNELIRDGALVLLSSVDIIDELIAKKPDYFVKTREEKKKPFTIKPIIKEEKKKMLFTGLSDYEREVAELIEQGCDTQTLIEEKISFEASRLTGLLSMMEIKGIIKKSHNKKYELQ